MDSTITMPSFPVGIGEPAWDVARLFPNQGYWSEVEYLALNGNHLVEFSDGWVEVLPMPTMTHQLIVAWLYGRVFEFVSPQGLGRDSPRVRSMDPTRDRLGPPTCDPVRFDEPNQHLEPPQHRDAGVSAHRAQPRVIRHTSPPAGPRDFEAQPIFPRQARPRRRRYGNRHRR